MLDEVDRNKIIIMRYVDNKSMHEIARELRVSRNTVRKIINEYEAVASDVHSREEMSEYLTEPRKYDSSNRTQHSISDEYQKVIHECLHENEVKMMTGLKKAVYAQAGYISTAEKLTKFKADLLSLKPFPGDIGCFERLTYTVDKWSTITYENNHYSVPDKFVGEKIDIKVYSEKIVIMDGREK